MSQPANDEFSKISVMMKINIMKIHQTLAAAPKQQQRSDSSNNLLSQISKLPILKKEMEIQVRELTVKDGIVRRLSTVNAAEIQAVE
ncbi:hypothetical protein Tco_0309929 [Tanacetum coccineum]